MAPFDCASADSSESDAGARILKNCLSLNLTSSSCTLPNVDDNDVLSSSCFSELCRMKVEPLDGIVDENDDELTCLDWLQDINLMQSINPSARDVGHSSDPESDDKRFLFDGQKENTPMQGYHPVRNLSCKPPYSFSVLIFMAIEASAKRRLPVKDIYSWIAEHFPYYRRAPIGWRNSVRHNLSLNKCFRKVEKFMGKGSSWCIDPLFRPNLLQAMKRTPYYPFQQMQMSTCGSPSSSDDSWPSRCYYSDAKSESPETIACRRTEQACRTSADDIDVANTLASLKDVHHATHLSDRERKLSRMRADENISFVIRTPPPSTDHAYGYEESLLHEARSSLSPFDNRVGSPVDEVYEFDNYDDFLTDDGSVMENVEISITNSPPPKQHPPVTRRRKGVALRHKGVALNYLPKEVDEEDAEEEKRRLEGVNALLNLAANSVNSKRDKSRFASASGVLWARAICNRQKKSKLTKNSGKTVEKTRKTTRKRKIARKF